MKYTILGFRQDKLIESALSIEDAFLLRTIKDMYSSDRMDSLIQEEKRYIWIKHDYILSQIPILGSMSKLKRMLSKLSEDGFLESVLLTNKKGVAGRFYYVKYTDKLNNMEDYDSDTKCQNESTKVQNDTRPNVKMTLNQSSKRHNKDSSIKDSSIKDSYKEVIEDYTDIPDLITAINDFMDMRKKIKKPMTTKALKMMLAKLKVMSNCSEHSIEILNQSTMNCWQSIYEVKQDVQVTQPFDRSRFIE